MRRVQVGSVITVVRPNVCGYTCEARARGAPEVAEKKDILQRVRTVFLQVLRTLEACCRCFLLHQSKAATCPSCSHEPQHSKITHRAMQNTRHGHHYSLRLHAGFHHIAKQQRSEK